MTEQEEQGAYSSHKVSLMAETLGLVAYLTLCIATQVIE